MTEGGETGQIFISGGGTLSSDVVSSGAGCGGASQVSIEGEEVHNIAAITSQDGHTLNIDAEMLEQLAGTFKRQLHYSFKRPLA